MNNNEFILWLEGFLDASDGNGLSAEQLKKVKEKLKKTKDESKLAVGSVIFTPATTFITTTNPNTSFAYGYPSGSSWSYTNGNKQDIEGIEKDLLLD